MLHAPSASDPMPIGAMTASWWRPRIRTTRRLGARSWMAVFVPESIQIHIDPHAAMATIANGSVGAAARTAMRSEDPGRRGQGHTPPEPAPHEPLEQPRAEDAAGASSTDGARVASASAPTMAALPVSSKISRPAATVWNQVPPLEAALATQKRG